MAKKIQLDNNPESKKEFRKLLRKVLQSGHINFIIGSGASYPAIPLAGLIEQEVNQHLANKQIKEANNKLYDFLVSVQTPMNDLISNRATSNNVTVLENYTNFLTALENILLKRKTTILPKQANIFTTNYDLFIEKASEGFPILKVNDGFNRIPSLTNHFLFSPQIYFSSIFNNGNLYNYEVELPSINLIKLHGSISWKRYSNSIKFEVAERLLPSPLPRRRNPEITDNQKEEYINQFSLILPQSKKFEETIMDRTYYDLLRLFSNELDKENTLLIAFGFSFEDEHIYDITRRALKNPTLKILIFAYNQATLSSYESKFDGYSNVEIILPEEGQVIDFSKLIFLLESITQNGDPSDE